MASWVRPRRHDVHHHHQVSFNPCVEIATGDPLEFTQYRRDMSSTVRRCPLATIPKESSLSDFPDTFQDFFAKLTADCEEADEGANTLLEDKRIPRSGHHHRPHHHQKHRLSASGASPQTTTDDTLKPKRSLQERRLALSRRSFNRRTPERAIVPPAHLLPPPAVVVAAAALAPATAPAVARRRSSSIAVPRAPPDIHRFLQAEQQRPRRIMTTSGSGVGTGGQGQSTSPSPTPSPIPSPCPSRPVSPRPRYADEGGYRNRTASMPAVVPKHRPMLGQTRRSAVLPVDSAAAPVNTATSPVPAGPGVVGADGTVIPYQPVLGPSGEEIYRVRSFSITPSGIFNLGDSFRSRRSRSIGSVTSTGSSASGTSPRLDRNPSAASQTSELSIMETGRIPTFKVAMLGASGVGKTTLTYQFTTSEYICAYDTSLDEEFGQKTVSVLLDGKEADLEIVDHPAAEMSAEAFCSTYSPDVFVVVYSIIERRSFQVAEDILAFLYKSDYIATRGVILVGNKSDLERKREVSTTAARKVANHFGCKFIETSSGLDHNVDELLVGVLAQVQLNPRRQARAHRKSTAGLPNTGSGNSSSGGRTGSSGGSTGGAGKRLLRHLLGIKRKARSCENLLVL